MVNAMKRYSSPAPRGTHSTNNKIAARGYSKKLISSQRVLLIWFTINWHCRKRVSFRDIILTTYYIMSNNVIHVFHKLSLYPNKKDAFEYLDYLCWRHKMTRKAAKCWYFLTQWQLRGVIRQLPHDIIFQYWIKTLFNKTL